MPPPRVPVEILEQQPPASAIFHPHPELVHRCGKTPRRQDIDIREAVDQPQRSLAGGMDDRQRTLRRRPVVGRADVLRLITELGRPMPHGREHQVRFLPIEPMPGEDRPGFDEQHRLGRIVEEVRTQLISEQPPPV